MAHYEIKKEESAQKVNPSPEEIERNILIQTSVEATSPEERRAIGMQILTFGKLAQICNALNAILEHLKNK